MNPRFVESLIDEIIRVEGQEYTDHPKDAGGPTKFGVTEAVARAWGYAGEMQALPEEVARTIYAERFYFGPKFDRVATVSAEIAMELTDTGVNLGPARAVEFLQRCLNVFNREGKSYPDVSVDGQFGLMTEAALKSFVEHRGQEGVEVMYRALNCLQGAYYVKRAEDRPANESFVYGWIKNRVGL